MGRPQLLRTLAEKANAAHTAVLVIDMQNDFCAEGGFVHRLGMDLSGVQRIVPQIRRLVEAARSSGAAVVHVRSHFDTEYLLPPMLERLERKRSEPYCVSGTWGAEFLDGLQPERGDLVVEKHRYSGFYGTDLDILLRARSIQTIVLTGTATNNCVDGTGRDAFYNGYYVVMLSDATTAGSPDVHEAALKTADHAYAVIANVDDILNVWRG